MRVAVAAAAAVFAAAYLIGLTGAWQAVERRGFDALTVGTAPYKSEFPITIVGIDEQSFAQIGRQWPWPRRLHAQLTEQLMRSGAIAVAFDILLSEASTPEDDRALAEAIRAGGNVVMAADLSFQETAYARQWLRVDPLPAFVAAGARSGLANVQLDRDLVVRQIPEGRDVFWREIVRRVNEKRPGLIPEPPTLAGSLIRYVGPDRTFPYASYYQALEADKLLPEGAFRDQIVIVGLAAKASPDAGAAQPDTFATPFTGYTGWLSPGAEIHANVLESAISGRWITPAPAFAAPLTLLVAVSGTALALRRWRPLAGAAVALAMAALIVVGVFLLFHYPGVWLPAGSAVLGVAGIYAVYGAIAFLTERRRRAEARRAFSMYVSPEVVDDVLAHPERLKLGGERREITVLFTDLKGFTTLSEALGAEQVADVINEHFTRISAIAKRNGGTVTQFIGDAVMAIWNAPLDDPRHAARAVQAAHEMQADIAAMRRELAARGLPEIHMRIGLHTCLAIVGNLGAADRFNYTALGDGVNLASRLEGVNKLFGTGILLSGDTARGLDAGAPLRPVGRVIVKGKSEPVDIFTIEADAGTRERTVAALAAYRSRDWDASERVLREILTARGDDGVARHYLAMITSLRADPPGPAWDSAESLEKL